MNIDEQIDNTITTLKVLGMLPKNGRLCVRKGQLTLEADNQMQKIKRWIYRDSRDVTLIHIKNTMSNTNKLIKGIMNNQIELELKTWSLHRFLAEMINCQAGLVNLKTTYLDDTSMVATLDVICDRLQANCLELKTYLNNTEAENPENR